MSRKLLIFNWKMNPQSKAKALKLFNFIEARLAQIRNSVVVAPPFVYLSLLKSKHVALASQDVFFEHSGAFTGEISARQLKGLGVKYVIIGHSERRALGETDAIINKKLKAAVATGLHSILCVGEPKRRSFFEAIRFIKKQLTANLKAIGYSLLAKKLIVAYEPVWAIGTGKFDSPDDAYHVIAEIKKFLAIRYKLRAVRVLYGGSVNSKILPDYLKYKEIDGSLIGGASVKTNEIRRILS